MAYLAILSLSLLLSSLPFAHPSNTSCTDRNITVPTPPPLPQVLAGPLSLTLNGISGLAGDDAWAVGGWATTMRLNPLVEHWSGSTWSFFPGPSLAAAQSSLVAVTEGAPDDVWATGEFEAATSHGLMLAHWDGSSWAEYVRTGSLSMESISMARGVSDNVWAVGQSHRYLRPYYFTVPGTEHWNGHGWRVVLVPINRRAGHLYGVVTFANGDAIAVGDESDEGGGIEHSLIVREVGGSWSEVDDARRNDTYSAIAATSESDVWIAGSTSSDGKPFVERWNGAIWSAQRLPSPGAVRIDSISEDSPTDVWVAGYPNYLAHFDGLKWTADIYVHSGGDLASLGGIFATSAGALTAGSINESSETPDAIFATFAHC